MELFNVRKLRRVFLLIIDLYMKENILALSKLAEVGLELDMGILTPFREDVMLFKWCL